MIVYIYIVRVLPDHEFALPIAPAYLYTSIVVDTWMDSENC